MTLNSLNGTYPRAMLESLPTPEIYQLFAAHCRDREANFERDPNTALGMVSLHPEGTGIRIEVEGTGGDEPVTFRGADARTVLIDYLEE